MTGKGRRDFCIECRKETEYLLQKRDIVKTIKDKDYTFEITVAICAECGEEMSIPGLIDKNIQEIDKQFRAVEGLVSVDDIKKLMKIYNIGKAPLSLALGFGEAGLDARKFVKGRAIGTRDGIHVVGAFEAPLHFERAEPCGDQLVHAANRAIVLGTQGPAIRLA